MEKRLYSEPTLYDAPYWLSDTAADKLSPEDAAKKDAKEVADQYRKDVAEKIVKLTQSA